MSRPKKDPYVVSDATCKGCIHYGPLSEYSISSMWCCNYILDTGHCRPKGETCAECSVREVGPRQPRRVQIHIEKSSSSLYSKSERREDYGNEIINTSTQSIKSIMEGKL